MPRGRHGEQPPPDRRSAACGGGKSRGLRGGAGSQELRNNVAPMTVGQTDASPPGLGRCPRRGVRAPAARWRGRRSPRRRPASPARSAGPSRGWGGPTRCPRLRPTLGRPPSSTRHQARRGRPVQQVDPAAHVGAPVASGAGGAHGQAPGDLPAVGVAHPQAHVVARDQAMLHQDLWSAVAGLDALLVATHEGVGDRHAASVGAGDALVCEALDDGVAQLDCRAVLVDAVAFAHGEGPRRARSRGPARPQPPGRPRRRQHRAPARRPGRGS